MSGDRCVYCGAPVLWHGPGGVVFGDNSAAHLRCYEEHEAAREAAKTRGRNTDGTLASPGIDDAETGRDYRAEANGHADPLEEAEA